MNDLNDLAILKVLRDMTDLVDVLAQNVQRLTQNTHTHPSPAGETQQPYQQFPIAAVDRASIHGLRHRLQTMIDQIEKN